jgi:uncharacterized membrane protein YfcA
MIGFRLGLRTALLGIPAAVAGVLLAYRLPDAMLLAIVALTMPALAWYIKHPPHPKGETATVEGTARDSAQRIPMCCYSGSRLYANGSSRIATLVAPTGTAEHRDAKDRVYRYDNPRRLGQAAVGGAGGVFTGLVGFGVGVLGVAHLVINRIPMRIAVGTSHFVILVVTGVAVIMHLVEMTHSGTTPPWNVIAVNAASVLVGGQLAAWLAGRVPEQRMRTILVVLLIGLSLVTLYRAASLAY